MAIIKQPARWNIPNCLAAARPKLREGEHGLAASMAISSRYERLWCGGILRKPAVSPTVNASFERYWQTLKPSISERAPCCTAAAWRFCGFRDGVLKTLELFKRRQISDFDSPTDDEADGTFVIVEMVNVCRRRPAVQRPACAAHHQNRADVVTALPKLNARCKVRPAVLSWVWSVDYLFWKRTWCLPGNRVCRAQLHVTGNRIGRSPFLLTAHIASNT